MSTITQELSRVEQREIANQDRKDAQQAEESKPRRTKNSAVVREVREELAVVNALNKGIETIENRRESLTEQKKGLEDQRKEITAQREAKAREIADRATAIDQSEEAELFDTAVSEVESAKIEEAQDRIISLKDELLSLGDALGSIEQRMIKVDEALDSAEKGTELLTRSITGAPALKTPEDGNDADTAQELAVETRTLLANIQGGSLSGSASEQLRGF